MNSHRTFMIEATTAGAIAGVSIGGPVGAIVGGAALGALISLFRG